MKLLLVCLGILILIVGAGMIWARTAKRPSLGAKNGQLSVLPDKPNCVSTQNGALEQQMAPISYVGNQPEAQEKLLSIVAKLPRSVILEEKPGYIWVVYRSALFGFPDDVEFLFDDNNKMIHFRAAARLGYYDMGANRRRMAHISKQFEELS